MQLRYDAMNMPMCGSNAAVRRPRVVGGGCLCDERDWSRCSYDALVGLEGGAG